MLSSARVRWNRWTMLSCAVAVVVGLLGIARAHAASLHAVKLAQLAELPALAPHEYLTEFTRFTQRHSRTYSTASEKATRFDTFSRNVDLIRKHNHYREQIGATYSLGVGPFADMTRDEFRRSLGLADGSTVSNPSHSAASILPTTTMSPSDAHERVVQTLIANAQSLRSSGVVNLTHILGARTPVSLGGHVPDSIALSSVTLSSLPTLASGLPCSPSSSSSAPIPSCDWRSANLVTPVKNQLQCGACWAFSALATVESLWALTHGELRALSEQYPIDCAAITGGDLKCSGGQPAAAFKFTQYFGACAEVDYSYVAGSYAYCNTLCRPIASISTFSFVRDINSSTNAEVEKEMLFFVSSYSPVSAAIEADSNVFQHYSSGVINDPACGTNLDHAAAVIGFGVDSSSQTEYWLLKNSWGADWGEDGYVRLARNVNQCGIAQSPIVPMM